MEKTKLLIEYLSELQKGMNMDIVSMEADAYAERVGRVCDAIEAELINKKE